MNYFNIEKHFENNNTSKNINSNIKNSNNSNNIELLSNRLNILNLNNNIPQIFYPQNQFNNEINYQNNNNYLDKELIDNCINLCKEQNECRILQKKILENPKIVELIYPKIKDKIIELSNDQFGNYFIQKVIEYLKLEELEEILYNKISNQFRLLSLNQHGTRVIQKIFEKIINNDNLLNYYTLLLNPNLKDFIIDPNASHIIIKYVSLVKSPKNDFIIKFLCDNIFELATKKHSCFALQKCIEYSNHNQKKLLLNTIANQSFGLFTDQFGNYVVQYVINIKDFDVNKIIALNLLYDIPKFSSQKFSSNVIEKCLDCCDENTKNLIIEKFCEEKLIKSLLFDMYGNYVLQKVMILSKEPFKSKFFNIVAPLMDNLTNLSFGQKIYNKLLSSFPELNTYVKNNNKGNLTKKKNKNMKMINNNLVNNNISNNNLVNINNIMFNNTQFFNPNQFQMNYPIINRNMMNNFSNNNIAFMGNIDIQYLNNYNNNYINNMNTFM